MCIYNMIRLKLASPRSNATFPYLSGRGRKAVSSMQQRPGAKSRRPGSGPRSEGPTSRSGPGSSGFLSARTGGRWKLSWANSLRAGIRFVAVGRPWWRFTGMCPRPKAGELHCANVLVLLDGGSAPPRDTTLSTHTFLSGGPPYPEAWPPTGPPPDQSLATPPSVWN